MDEVTEKLEAPTDPREVQEINKGELSPIGVEELPPLKKYLVNPYRSPAVNCEAIASLFIAAPLLVSAGKDVAKGRASQGKMSRRTFFKLAGAGIGGIATYSLTKGYPTLLKETSKLSDTGSLAMQTPEVVVYCLWLDIKAKPDYQNRLLKKLSLPPAIESKNEYEDRVLTLRFKHPATGALVEFHGYKAQGRLTPVFGEKETVAGRNDYFHQRHNTPFVAFYNATAPGAIMWAESLRIEPRADLTLSPTELTIIYASSSLFIPLDAPPNSPVWTHALNRLTQPNPLFTELTLRPNDPTHQGYGFTKEGSGRLIGQEELMQIINNKRVPEDLTAVTLNQFAYDPRTNSMAERGSELPFGQDFHRMLTILLTDKDGNQYVVAGPPNYYLTAPDYDRVISEFSRAYKTEFQAVVCLDLGMAGGFTLLDGKKILKPNFRRITGKDEMNLSFAHTGSVALIDQV